MIILLHSFDIRAVLGEQIIKRQQTTFCHLLLESKPIRCKQQVHFIAGGHHQVCFITPCAPVDGIQLDRHVHFRIGLLQIVIHRILYQLIIILRRIGEDHYDFVRLQFGAGRPLRLSGARRRIRCIIPAATGCYD
ncbi:hypothetical protein D3C75_882230 [compost metagenome]